VVAKATQLSITLWQKLSKLLWKYEEIFDGMLGKWNTEPVDIEL
jgi:hypothetical protein